MLKWLFDTSMGPPGPSGHWPSWMTFLFCASNFFIAMALMSVPIVVTSMLRRRRKGIRKTEWWVLVSIFPVLAATRAVRFIEFVGVPYHLTTLIDVLAAMISVFAASRVPRIAEHMMLLPSREVVHEIREAWNAERMDIEAERMAMRENYRRLSRKIDALELMVLDGHWSDDVRQAIRELRFIVAHIGETDHGN